MLQMPRKEPIKVEQVTPYLITALGGLIMVLVGLISWVGSNITSKLDRLAETVSDNHVKTTERLARIESEVKDLDRRVGALEQRA